MLDALLIAPRDWRAVLLFVGAHGIGAEAAEHALPHPPAILPRWRAIASVTA
ncbi:hypothetical protein AKJ09_00178 [Labilithrix luteola]|uniref:Uncharacterized protein n=1 Tax=Labilithrix luteola TaxID=1391654 RepID=A0A0K1PK77_9BACT|nr:hypothetical protein AKJ09_00178 [Labilithrix luteola]